MPRQNYASFKTKRNFKGKLLLCGLLTQLALAIALCRCAGKSETTDRPNIQSQKLNALSEQDNLSIIIDSCAHNDCSGISRFIDKQKSILSIGYKENKFSKNKIKTINKIEFDRILSEINEIIEDHKESKCKLFFMLEINGERHKICRESKKYSKLSEIVKQIDYLISK